MEMRIASIHVSENKMEVNRERPVTSGMVGATVEFAFDPEWDGLTKTAVFIAGSVTKDVVDIADVVTIPHEVMAKPGLSVKVGVYGTNADGTVVIPTVYGTIAYTVLDGADPSGDPSADPTLPPWVDLQNRVKKLEENPDSGGNVALTADQIAALHGMFKVCAFTKADISAEYNAFKTAFGITDSGEEEPDEPEVTLSSISATYSGGDVPVGTAVSALTGIVVTAHYSDGTSEPVTAYTMTGTIGEGSNTITVTYEGKTATFTVTGVAESGGGEAVTNLYVRNGEYLYGSPTDVTWGDNSLSYKMGTHTNGVYTHVGEAYHLESGKTYTLFADMEDKAEFVRVLYKANDANAYLGTQLGQLTNTASYYTFTVPADAKWVNLLFGLQTGTDAAATGDLGTWNNIAIYEGEMTERP